MNNINKLVASFYKGDKKALSRCISYVENELPEYENIRKHISFKHKTCIIGVTGPPGAGKSTLINGMINELLKKNHKIGVLAIDPTSPFNFGSLLGDRIRMAEHFNNPNVFIRSLATRGALGGLSAKTNDIVDVMKAFGFDYIIVETVGVGQSEVEIAWLADTTILVLVPEAGDEIQTIKSGIMEIADIFIVNKADRHGADTFVKNLQTLTSIKHTTAWLPIVIKTIATKNEGIDQILKAVEEHGKSPKSN